MQCRHVSCHNRAGVFGACSKHERRAIIEEFARAINDGVAQHEPPRCFTFEQWREYVVASRLAAQTGRGDAPIEPCRDCTKRQRDVMLTRGQCAHPETVFIRESRSGEVVGVPLLDPRRPRVWEQAVMGVSGQVVGMPSSENIGVAMHAISTSKRGPGRPRKDEQR